MSEKVCQNSLSQLIYATILLYYWNDLRVVHQTRDLVQARHNRIQDTWNLVVLVDEHQSIGHVVIAQVNDTAADPLLNLFLHLTQDPVHDLADTRSVLNTIQTLVKHSLTDMQIALKVSNNGRLYLGNIVL